jgi:hypothetical protein
MGCDYYIDKNLVIYYINDNRREYINLEHNQGYFYDINIDSDDEDYDKKEEESVKEQLMPSMKPILIYKNNTFSKPIFEEKYKNLILQNLPENKTWTDIQKIMKKESRYERD